MLSKIVTEQQLPLPMLAPVFDQVKMVADAVRTLSEAVEPFLVLRFTKHTGVANPG